ncbi:leucyl aminopeptidase family protein [Paenibacillus senegalensis]|uniref:leucyl aminopeptidase family protein n=1 Tax=Paenibacillus senegalensis TaxID=1465766 RepID=UPI0002899154|nr:leucyl aminopeptidase family protein [Paenibacillus senegalensis]
MTQFSVGALPSAEVTLIAICQENMKVPVLDGFEIREEMAGKGSLTWFRSRPPHAHILLVGLGQQAKLTPETIRIAAGKAGREAAKAKVSEVAVDFSFLTDCFRSQLSKEDAAAAWVEGWLLGTYRFDKYKSKEAELPVRQVAILDDPPGMEQAVKFGEIRARGTMLARDLGNEPPNALRPAMLAERVREHFQSTAVEVTVLSGDGLVKENLNGLIAVGKGSSNPPALIEMRYSTDPTLPLIALVGKGITFDTGGISLKSGRNLSDMRIDMGGSAAVIGAMDILANSGIQANVIALVAAAENMPDGGAMLPGEVITYANGISVQVGNTDAEGRLVLADALIRAGQLGAKQIVDIATLTGACVSALGNSRAGVWGTDGLPDKLKRLGEHNGEKVWEMPLEEEYEELLKSSYADICNITGVPYAGATTAALFLRRFVDPSIAWAHVDMAGPMDSSKTKGYLVEGASGYGARLLADFVAEQSRS